MRAAKYGLLIRKRDRSVQVLRRIQQALAADSVERGESVKGEAEVERNRSPLKRVSWLPEFAVER